MEENNVNLKNKKLALFFSYKVSLELWQKRGMLTRELKLYQELGKYFDKIYFITYGRNDYKFIEELRKYNIEVLYKKFWCPNFIYSLILPLVYRFELKGCDFYKTNQMSGSWSAVLAKWLFSKKLLIRMGFPLSLNAKTESVIKYFFSRLAESLALRNANKIIVTTKEDKEYFKKYSEKISIIPNYVDTDLFKPIPELKNKNDQKIILFVGRLSQEKNLENLLKAMVGIENVKLQIIGSGLLEEKLKQEAKDLQIQVEFFGNIPHEQLPEYINKANIFVLPSLYEGNPKVLLEAMACKSMILGANVRGINSIITHMIDGYLCDVESSSLNKAIKILFADNDSENKISKNAYLKIINNYSMSKIIHLELANYD